MVYTLRFFFSSKCSLFHNSNIFGSCFIHILYTGCSKKINSGAKRLKGPRRFQENQNAFTEGPNDRQHALADTHDQVHTEA